MENKALSKPSGSRSLSLSNDWMEKFMNAPHDEFFNFGKVLNMPAVNVSETEKEYTLRIAAPGLEKQDFKLEVLDDMLTISAEKEREEKTEDITGGNITTAVGAEALRFRKIAMPARLTLHIKMESWSLLFRELKQNR